MISFFLIINKVLSVSLVSCLFNDINCSCLFDISSKRRRLWYVLRTFLLISFKQLTLVKEGYRLHSGHQTKKFISSLHFSTFACVLSTVITVLNVELSVTRIWYQNHFPVDHFKIKNKKYNSNKFILFWTWYSGK